MSFPDATSPARHEPSNLTRPPSGGAAPNGLRPSGWANVGARAALYAEKEALMTCARQAKRVGLRVVTALYQDAGGAGGLSGNKLTALVARLGEGEFEVIVADAGAGRVVTIAAALIEDERAEDHAAVAPTLGAVDPQRLAAVTLTSVPAVGKAIRCAVYARCATSIQAEGDPLAAQVGTCEAYAAEQDWETVEVFSDAGVSGKEVLRPGLDQMMVAAKGGTFDILLVEELSRLSRDALDTQRLLEDMNALGVAVHTVGGGPICATEAAFRAAMTKRSLSEAAARQRLRSGRKLRSSYWRLGRRGGEG